MGSLASINVKFTADLREFSTEMQNSLRAIEKTGQQFQKVGRTMSVAVTAPIALLAAKSLQLFDVQAKAVAQVEAGLKSTGNAVGYTSTQLQKMASDLQNVSLFGDEEILKGVTAQLLTFTNIAGDQFAKTQQAALDLATRLDGDLKSATIQLGKALNDPIANLSALSRSGIQFSASQKTVINSLQQSGKLAEAQTIILAELEKQYGGSAKAAAEAGLGPLKQLSNSWGDLLETFGAIIADGIKPLVSYLKGLVDELQGMSPVTKQIIVVVAGLAAAIGPLLFVIGAVLSIIPAVVAGFALVSASILPILAGLTLLLGAFLIIKNAMAETAVATVKLTDSQKLIQKVTDEATASIVDQKAQLESYLDIARDESKTRKEKLAAIKEINKLSPEFLGNITLETINTGAATTAIDKYNAALLRGAKARAAQETLQELYKEEIVTSLRRAKAEEKLVKLKADSSKKQFNSYKEQQQYNNLLNDKSGVLAVIQAQEDKNRKAQIDTVAKIYNDGKQYLGLLKETGAQYDVNTDKSNKNSTGKRDILDPIAAGSAALSTGTIEAYDAEIAKLKQFRDQVATTAEQIKLADDKIAAVEFAKALNFDPSSIIKATETTEVMMKRLAASVSGEKAILQAEMVDISAVLSQSVSDLAVSVTASFGEAIGGLIAGTENIGSVISGMLGMIAGFMSDLGKQLIALGIAKIAFDKIAISGVGAVIAGTALVALASIFKSTLSKGPKPQAFANGGIVGGSSYYGDKILARVNSSELILNTNQQRKLYGAIGGNNGGVIISDVVLKGNDLYLSFKRTEERNNRTR